MLILVSAYTANLANVLVASAAALSPYTTYSNAVQKGATFCSPAGYDTALAALSLRDVQSSLAPWMLGPMWVGSDNVAHKDLTS